jgi:Na+:H+ antiporter, NhaC family
MSESPRIIKSPSLTDAMIPVSFLIIVLLLTEILPESPSGTNQVTLLLSAAIAALVGMKNGFTWQEIESGIIDTIKVSLQAILILLVVGSLIGAWILSGTVPSMIYYGVELMSPDYFYFTACLVCALLGFCIGSSWTVAGTLGIGLIGIAAALDLSLAISAGAIISGAYFGDKLSPLSETTNLAASLTNNNVFVHIQHMLWTTVPAILLTLTIFFFLGIGSSADVIPENIAELQKAMKQTFYISPLMLGPLLLLLAMAVKKLPALPTLICGTLVGCIFAIIFQWDSVVALAGDSNLHPISAGLKGLLTAMASGYSIVTDNPSLDTLLSKGGVNSMLGTIGLVISALSFGGAMAKTGLLKKLVEAMLSKVKSAGGLITATVGTCIGTNVLAADQYLSIVLPGQMFVEPYKEHKLKSVNLSRTLEDSGTLTSALVPWNTCGAYMTGTLGVSTFAYAPFAFFNILCPIIAIIYGFSLIAVPSIDEEKA